MKCKSTLLKELTVNQTRCCSLCVGCFCLQDMYNFTAFIPHDNLGSNSGFLHRDCLIWSVLYSAPFQQSEVLWCVMLFDHQNSRIIYRRAIQGSTSYGGYWYCWFASNKHSFSLVCCSSSIPLFYYHVLKKQLRLFSSQQSCDILPGTKRAKCGLDKHDIKQWQRAQSIYTQDLPTTTACKSLKWRERVCTCVCNLRFLLISDILQYTDSII